MSTIRVLHTERVKKSDCNSCTAKSHGSQPSPFRLWRWISQRLTPYGLVSFILRLKILQDDIMLFCLESNRTRLIDVCKTRWAARIEGLYIFEELYIAIVKTLEQMDQNLDKQIGINTQSKAGPLLLSLKSFVYLVALVITRHIFDLMLPVTKLLQSKTETDILDGCELINSLKNLTMSIRNNIDYHNEWYSSAIDLASKVDILEHKKKNCGRQTTRSNVTADSPSQYYKRDLHVVPSKFVWSENQIGEQVWIKNFRAFAEFYRNDLPNPLALEGKIKLWQQYWSDYDRCLPDNVIKTLKAVKFDGFENIKVALRILATLPVTSCECERSFSSLRRLKDYTRSTMVQDRLNGIALMYIHKEILPNIDAVIDRYAMCNRRLSFS
ncbi:52 kDa repressor of the inhibitor of the protein kinase-like [Hydractinia symbiolongicarpus]|uniref:52 kDa repressor of the inhibitor of the protein kinase-like n=1 Tax=Hydractinia symbiolongicarpus TaxID=13093 RepID=UPI002550E4C0|nr:52 kDa repressor of the inhibitor of the protein kinase-like [Hydractinia symbiolongicarpus]